MFFAPKSYGLKKLLIALLAIMLGVCTLRSEEVSLEYQVKAACLFNFAKYVHWPDEAIAGGEIYLCIAGKDPFKSIFSDTTERSAQGKKLVVKRFPDSVDIASVSKCHILYWASDGIKGQEQVLQDAKTKPILSVSDGKPEAIIDFRIEDGKVRFAIDKDNAEKVKLSMSSQLLRLAIVKD